MTKRTFVTALIVSVALVLAAGGLMASNMGFKLNYTLNAAGASSAGGDNTLGLSYNRQQGIDFAADLRTDIGAGNLNSISEFDPATGGFPPPYTGLKGGGPNFDLETCRGVFVNMAVDVDYITVGSHDPSFACQLTATGDTLPGGGTSAGGDNFFAPPYHTTAATAADLRNDIGAGAVNSISEFDRATGGYPPPYTGLKGGGPNFNIDPGKAYFVNMGTTVNYTPSHY